MPKLTATHDFNSSGSEGLVVVAGESPGGDWGMGVLCDGSGGERDRKTPETYQQLPLAVPQAPM